MIAVDAMPVLSAGRHRSPRRGACFMEYASFLAGERWSDAPECTDPVLAHLARLVNDLIPAGERSTLAPLIPSVVGLRPQHPLAADVVAIRAAESAIAVASESRQCAIALGVLLVRDGVSDGIATREAAELIERIDSALEVVPFADRWARQHLHATARRTTPAARLARAHRARAALVTTSAVGLAEACIPDAGPRLRAVLAAAIADLRALDASHAEPAARPAPAASPEFSAPAR